VTHPAPHDRSDLDALPREQKALLLSGRNFWSTEPVEEVGLPSVLLTDGPHGVRRQKGASDHLPAAQVELIRAVAAVSRRTVVVLSSGGVVALEGWHDDVDTVLAGFLLGQAGGSALADLLTGVVAPSGRLAERSRCDCRTPRAT
jgi:hypothetical protein